jgi:hypothetical protein
MWKSNGQEEGGLLIRQANSINVIPAKADIQWRSNMLFAGLGLDSGSSPE